jgi:hypothetical protein
MPKKIESKLNPNTEEATFLRGVAYGIDALDDALKVYERSRDKTLKGQAYFVKQWLLERYEILRDSAYASQRTEG